MIDSETTQLFQTYTQTNIRINIDPRTRIISLLRTKPTYIKIKSIFKDNHMTFFYINLSDLR